MVPAGGDSATSPGGVLLLFKRKEKLYTAVLIPSGRDLPVMQLDGIFHNGQSKPGPSGFPGAAIVDAVEALKYAVQVLFINLAAGIGKREIVVLFVPEIVGKIDL